MPQRVSIFLTILLFLLCGEVEGGAPVGENRVVITERFSFSVRIHAALTLAAVDGRGIRTEFHYDARFRLTSSTCTAIPDDDQFRGYDLAGRLLSANRATAGDKRNVSYTYDALDRTTSETSVGFTHLYGHDRAGNLTRVHYQETGRRLASAFDPLNRLSTVTETLDGSAGERVTGYVYDLSGNLLLKTLPNGTAEAGGYDALNRRITRATTRGGVTVSAFDYGHDAAGNVVVIREARGSTAVPDRFIRNTYDRAYRLLEEETSSLDATGAVEESTVVSYTYDRADNRATKSTAVNGGSAATISYTYGSAANGLNSNQLATFTEGGDTTSFTYDANGNRLTRAVNATLSDSYKWDSANRLVSLEKGAATYLYGYDHRTRRVIRDESDADGEETLVSFSGGSGVFEKEGAAVTVEFIRGSDMGGGVGGILYSVRGGAYSFSAYDGRGDVVAKTNAAGTVEWEASYEAFGARTEENGENEDRYRANTKEEDPTGLLNEGFRFRDVETGAFISRDPLGFVDGPNVYSYVIQNPWSAFDPFGLATTYQDEDENSSSTEIEEPEYEPVPESTATVEISDYSARDLNELAAFAYYHESSRFEGYTDTSHDRSPALWSLTSITAELNEEADSGRHNKTLTALFRQQSQSASNAAHNLQIIMFTVEGVGWVAAALEPSPFGESVMLSGRVAANSGRGLSKHGGVFSETVLDNGGSLWTSTGRVSQNDFAPLVNGGLYRGTGQVNVLSGVHGLPNGRTILDRSLFDADVARFSDIPGVNIHNLPDLTPAQITDLIRNPNTTIGGFCDSASCLNPFR